MSLKDLIAADVSAVIQNTDETAETWMQWPQGDAGRAKTVIVNPNFPIEFDDSGTERSTRRGDEQITKFPIYIADTVTVHSKDVWIDENDLQYRTVDLGPIDGRMRRINIQRNDIDHLSRPGAGTLL